MYRCGVKLSCDVETWRMRRGVVKCRGGAHGHPPPTTTPCAPKPGAGSAGGVEGRDGVGMGRNLGREKS